MREGESESAGGTWTGSNPRPEVATMPKIYRRRRTGRWIVLGTLIAVVAAVAAGASVGWFSALPLSGRCSPGTTILGEGSSFVLPLLSDWQPPYQGSSGNLVNFDPAGSAAGISALQSRVVDFAATDEPLDRSTIQGFPSPVLSLPVVGGAVAIVYNLPGATRPVELTGNDLAEIYLGGITHWNDPRIASINSGLTLPAEAIVTVHRADAAGTTFVLTDYLAQDDSNWSSGPGRGLQIAWPALPLSQARLGNTGLARYVQSTPYSIGYTDLADALALSGLAVAMMGNPSGAFVAPTLASTGRAIDDQSARASIPPSTGDWSNISMVNAPGRGDYPVAALVYLLTNAEMDRGFAPSLLKARAVVDWLNWTVSQGQSYAAGLGFVALPPALLQVDRAGIASATYQGVPVGACGA